MFEWFVRRGCAGGSCFLGRSRRFCRDFRSIRGRSKGGRVFVGKCGAFLFIV